MLIDEISGKTALQSIIRGSPGPVVLKFGAEWCGPCKQIEPLVKDWFNRMPDNVTKGVLDVDDNFELYAHLKSKRVIPSIPAMLMYEPGNDTVHAPDIINLGSNKESIDGFFTQVIARSSLQS
jgi:thioredoxin 1